MIRVERYSVRKKDEWDGFIAVAKNSTFMLNRSYMDYHADRFEDASLMFYEDDSLLALLPATIHGQELRSHGGLTYGGLIVDRHMTTPKELKLFTALREYMMEQELSRLIYKRVPAIYYSYPADEDLYALFRNDARLIRRDVSTAINLEDAIPFSSIRRRMIKKANKQGLVVCQSDDFEGYVNLLSKVLSSRHAAKPVHTAAELRLLASRFPDVIKLFCAFQGDTMLAGVLIFDTPNVVHTQYIANSDEGCNVGALDLVMDYLVHEYSVGKKYFDFGIANENEGRVLNEGLIGQKEMFGGRAVIHDFYELLPSECDKNEENTKEVQELV